MIKHLLYIGFILIVLQSKAQNFQPLANGLTINAFYHQQGLNYHLCTSDENNFVYNVFYDTVTSNFNVGREYSQVRLQIYNGISWLFSPPVKLYSQYSIDAPRVLCINYFKGSIYIGGTFDSTDVGSNAGIVKFNGQNWESVGVKLIKTITNSVAVNKIEVYNGGMMLVGDFDSISNFKINGLINYDGQNWKGVGLDHQLGLIGNSNINNVNFRSINDTLFVFIKDITQLDSIQISNNKTGKCGFIDGLELKSKQDVKENISDLLSFQKQIIYLISSKLRYISQIKYFKNGSWTFFSMTDSFYVTNYMGFLEFESRLYLFFQNPVNPSIDIYEFNGIKITKIQSWKHSNAYISLNFYRDKWSAIISGNFNEMRKNQSSASYQNIARFNPSVKSVVTCLAFHDLNNDQIKQANEPIIANAKIEELNHFFVTNTNQIGIANFYIKSLESHEFKALPILGLKSNNTYVLDLVSDSNYYIEFPYSNASLNDVSLNMFSNTANLIKIGQETTYIIKVANSSDVVKIVNIKVKHPSRTKNVVFDNFSLLVTQKNRDHFVFSDQILPHQSKNYLFSCFFDSDSFELNEKIEMNAAFLTQESLTNNQDVFEQTIVNEVKANLKVATPDVVANAQKQIKYHIYFQNMSSDTVLNVTVVDTFGSLLDLRKIVIGGASHGYSYSIQNNVFIWHFNQIKLPPKSKDSLKSRGFVSFTSYINNQAQIGDTISNKAAVFYDYQKPIITNSAKVYVKKETSIISKDFNNESMVFPNPTDGELTLINYQNERVEIFDHRGSLMVVILTDENGVIQFPKELSNGLYLVKPQSFQSAFYKVILNR
jgi:hypothetical protein